MSALLHSGPTAPAVMHLISSLKVGGSERLLVSTMQAAARDRSQAYVAVIMNDQIDPGLFAELRATGHPVYRLGRSEGHMHPRYLKRILDIAREHNVGLIHTHNDGSLAWGMAAKVARPSLKLVYTQHAQGGAQEFHGLRRRAYRALVDMTVAISPFIAQEMRELSQGRVTLCPNGVDLARFRNPGRVMSASPPTRIVHVARFAPVKGQDILIRAVRRCVDLNLDVTCTLVGSIVQRDFYEGIVALIDELELKDRIRIELDRTDVETFLHNADIFVLPSRQEGFGIAIIEAMAAGLPVIVSATGGAKDLVADAVNGLHFTPGDDSNLAMQLLLLSSDMQLRQRCMTAALETAAQFDISRTLGAKNAIYRALLAPERHSIEIGETAMLASGFSDSAPPQPAARKGAQGVDAKAMMETP